VAREPYHFSIIKTHLTRQLTALFPSIEDEITLSLSETFDSANSGKKKKKHRLHSISDQCQ